MYRLRTDIVFGDQRCTVTVVQSLEFRVGGSNHKRFLAGSLKPIAVIVKEPDRSYVLDMDSRSVDIEKGKRGRIQFLKKGSDPIF